MDLSLDSDGAHPRDAGQGPLSGIRVLEVASWGFVPSCGAILAEWGAEVIKVEPPRTADPQRGIDATGLVPRNEGMNLMWEVLNRGKLGIALDLDSTDGAAALKALLLTADVFLTNNLPRTRQRFGTDVEDVRAINPHIIYARGSGHGSTGPEAEEGSYDAVAFWARSGAAHCATVPDAPDVAPLPGVGFGDFTSGMALAGGVAAAVAQRERTGHAAVVDASLLSAGLWAVSPHLAADGEHPVRPDRRATPEPLVNAYRTRDGRYFYLTMLGSDRFWAGFCTLLGRSGMADDPRFGSADARAENAAACVAAIEAAFAERDAAEWEQVFGDFDGPICKVLTPLEAQRDQQVIANDFLYEVRPHDMRSYRVVGAPARLDGRIPVLDRAPNPGEHTEQVLRDARVDAGVIERTCAAVSRTAVVESR